MKTCAISDIHGCHRTFLALLDQLAFSQADTLYLLGDYTDRGPDSKAVLDTILDMQAKGYRITCLRGNHDQMLLDAHRSPADQDFWLQNGGAAALNSFGCKTPEEIPARYTDFLDSLPCLATDGPYILVHAGLNFSAPDPLQDQQAMLWIRRWYDNIDYDWLGERIILHGHTPLPRETFDEQYRHLHRLRYLDLDGGCVYRRHPAGKMGRLCAFDLTNQTVHFQECIDKIPPPSKHSTF